MLKNFLAISLTLSKVSLLVLLSSMNLWGSSAMSMEMPCGKMIATENSKCEICALAIENLSEKFVKKSEKKIEIQSFAGFLEIPLTPFLKGESILSLELGKYVFPPPKLLSRSSYLFAKKKIALVI